MTKSASGSAQGIGTSMEGSDGNMADSALDTARDRFMERIGIVAQAEGMTRIAGRAFALLIFDGEEIAFGALAERLQVSRASVSTNMRLLEERGLVLRLAKTGARQDYFRLADDAFGRMLKVVRERSAQAHAEIDATLHELPREAHDVRARVEAYSQFYTAVDEGLGFAISKIARPQE
ncbi:GbsR/MarR family transcriptional regulator [Profundibacterium mesophilum]|uniref:MarR familydomain containing protein n=1 Tax=Profundibacterium mesophilum KAUST100406-0324 TaxID=1037889 RepID=A0A921NUX6_9RHOB|nr:MarR family transcriptional regulator [Profundibacterium mesophilum]KAF0675249.1 MarR familydomain containing protein [Profundibacterium mesophilum KAUST100406-0324]